LFFEPAFETRQFQSQISSLSLELGAGRQQALPREDLCVLLDPLSLDLGFCGNSPRLSPGVGDDPGCGSARASPQGPLDHEDNESEEQQSYRCYLE
jgi:hypothetical protein